MNKLLTDDDYKKASDFLHCDIALIKAVSSVESGKYGGFLPSGEPVILFEPYTFYNLTNGKFNGERVLINNHLYPLSLQGSWNRIKADYGPVEIQHSKLQGATKLDRDNALQSCSWGKFQIMGFNYAKCGFKSLQDFINAMYKNEGEHLYAFCNFLKNTFVRRGWFERKFSLAELLAGKDFNTFTKGYNGSGQVKEYSKKLADAYNKFKQ